MNGMISTQIVEGYMILTYKELGKIQFPVFMLPSSNWHTQDGLFYVDNTLVDDRNIDKPTLGLRRISSPQGPFVRLSKAVVDEVGLFKQTTKSFIDTNGVPFIYARTKFVSLQYYKIEDIEGLGHSCRIKLQGIRERFLVPSRPHVDMQWAGVLHLHGYPWKIYEWSETYKPSTRRKI